MISQGDKDSGRKEHDSFGEIEVPASAAWGAQTERARFSTMIFGGEMPLEFIYAVAQIKAAAARANARLGLLPADIASAIQDVVKDILHSRYEDQFPLDVFQSGHASPVTPPRRISMTSRRVRRGIALLRVACD